MSRPKTTPQGLEFNLALGQQPPRQIEANEIYILPDHIEYGGFSEVVTALWANPERDGDEMLAVKIFRRIEHEEDARVLETFERRLKKEVACWQRVPPHENILPFIGVYVSKSRASGLVSPFRQGGNILDYIRNHGSVEHSQLAIGIAAGVAHLHSHEIIHGDLTPKNIVIYVQGGEVIPQIADFGRAKKLDDQNYIGSVRFTVRSEAADDWEHRYTAPEIVLHESCGQTNEGLSKCSDVWSLGMVLLHVLSGVEPFPSKTDAHIVQSLRVQQELSPADYRMSSCPVRGKAWPLLTQCWMIKDEPEKRCTAHDCLVAFREKFPRVVNTQRANGVTVERDILEAMDSKQPLN